MSPLGLPLGWSLQTHYDGKCFVKMIYRCKFKIVTSYLVLNRRQNRFNSVPSARYGTSTLIHHHFFDSTTATVLFWLQYVWIEGYPGTLRRSFGTQTGVQDSGVSGQEKIRQTAYFFGATLALELEDLRLFLL